MKRYLQSALFCPSKTSQTQILGQKSLQSTFDPIKRSPNIKKLALKYIFALSSHLKDQKFHFNYFIKFSVVFTPNSE